MREAVEHDDQGWQADSAEHGAADPDGQTAGVALLEAPSIPNAVPLAVEAIHTKAIVAEAVVADLQTTRRRAPISDRTDVPLALWYLRFPFDCF